MEKTPDNKKDDRRQTTDDRKDPRQQKRRQTTYDRTLLLLNIGFFNNTSILQFLQIYKYHKAGDPAYDSELQK